MLTNVLPIFDDVKILRKEHAHRYHAESYDVEVMDRISLDNSLFLAKRSIDDLFRDLLEEKKRF